MLYQNWGIAYDEWFKSEFGADAAAGVRVDYSGLALRLISNLDYLGFLPESVAREGVKKGILKSIEYSSKTAPPDMTVYLTYLKSREREYRLASFLAFVRENARR